MIVDHVSNGINRPVLELVNKNLEYADVSEELIQSILYEDNNQIYKTANHSNPSNLLITSKYGKIFNNMNSSIISSDNVMEEKPLFKRELKFSKPSKTLEEQEMIDTEVYALVTEFLVIFSITSLISILFVYRKEKKNNKSIDIQPKQFGNLNNQISSSSSSYGSSYSSGF